MNFKPPVGTKPNLAHPLMKGLVGWWLLNEGSGVKVFDSSGRNNTGTMTNMANPATATSGWGAGKFGKVLKYDGTDDYVIADNNTSVTSAQTSISVWIKLNTLTSNGRIIDMRDGTNGIQILYSTGDLKVNTKHSQFQSGFNSTTWFSTLAGVLYHLVGVFDSIANTVALYVNGIPQTGVPSGSVGNGNAVNKTYLGIRSDLIDTSQFDGVIDDVRIYNRALSAQEVWQLYNKPFSMFDRVKRYFAGPVGITFDAASNSGYKAASSSYTWSHTNAGNFLAVDVSRLSVPGTTVTGITFNGDALTQIGTQSTGTDAGNVSLWGMVAPDIGTFDIAVTLSAVAISAGTAVSYSGVHQASPTEGFNGATAVNVGAADATVNVTSIADNCWIHAAVATDDTAITAGQTTRNNVTGAGGSGANEDFGPHTPAGLKAMTYTDVAALAAWVIGGYVIRPLEASSLITRLIRRMLSGIG